MKPDILSIAAFVFVLGVLASSVNATDVFRSDTSAPAALQQGLAINR